MSKVLILRCSSTNEHHNGDCDAAYIKIDLQYARVLAGRKMALMALRTKDSEVSEIQYRDDLANFITRDMDKETEEETAVFDSLDDGAEFKYESMDVEKFDHVRMDYSRVVLDMLGDKVSVYWIASPRGDSNIIRTEAIEVDRLYSLARAENA
jgi:hypothetical protein